MITAAAMLRTRTRSGGPRSTRCSPRSSLDRARPHRRTIAVTVTRQNRNPGRTLARRVTAIVQDTYGSPDVLDLRDIDPPVVKGNDPLDSPALCRAVRVVRLHGSAFHQQPLRRVRLLTNATPRPAAGCCPTEERCDHMLHRIVAAFTLVVAGVLTLPASTPRPLRRTRHQRSLRSGGGPLPGIVHNAGATFASREMTQTPRPRLRMSGGDPRNIAVRPVTQHGRPIARPHRSAGRDGSDRVHRHGGGCRP